MPLLMPMRRPARTYVTVIQRPKLAIMSTTRYSLMIGDVTRKVNAMPSGTCACRKPMNMGIEEQEQNGVMAPKRAAAR